MNELLFATGNTSKVLRFYDKLLGDFGKKGMENDGGNKNGITIY